MNVEVNKGIVVVLAVLTVVAVFWFSGRDAKDPSQTPPVQAPAAPQAPAQPQAKASLPKPDWDELKKQLPPLPRKEKIAEKKAKSPSGGSWTETDYPANPEQVYYNALIFRDEALATFPVYTVEIHKPESIIRTSKQDAGDGPWQAPPNPRPNEVWIRVKPANAREMTEIMAQTADLYRQYVDNYQQNVRIINWVGGQPWASREFGPDGSAARP